jgi:hypothetical protein
LLVIELAVLLLAVVLLVELVELEEEMSAKAMPCEAAVGSGIAVEFAGLSTLFHHVLA